MTKRSVILFLSASLLCFHANSAQIEKPAESLGIFSLFTSYFSAPAQTAPNPVDSEAPEGPTLEDDPTTAPPVWIFYNRFCATIGLDPQIKITPLKKEATGHYLLKVTFLGSDQKKADALATLFAKTRILGGATAVTKVYDLNGNQIEPKPFPDTVLDAMVLIKTALENNPMFRSIKEGNQYYAFFIEFAFILVQFNGDRMDDYYKNFNESAAYAFLNSLDLDNINVLRIGTTTELVELAYEITTKPSGVRVYIPKKLEMKTDTGNW